MRKVVASENLLLLKEPETQTQNLENKCSEAIEKKEKLERSGKDKEKEAEATCNHEM